MGSVATDTHGKAFTAAEVVKICKEHTIYSWSKTEAVDPWPFKSANGVWVYSQDGQKIIDFNSMLMCVNLGHSHPKVIQKMKEATDDLIFAYPGAATEPRAKLALKLAEIMPKELNTFFFALSGAESNENAIRFARVATGRNKVMARYRSFHGASNLTVGLTGDPRRIPNEPSPPGIVHFFDPYPYEFSFGDNDEEIVENYMKYFEETLTYEGPESIACVIMETVTGTNGILAPPKGLFAKMHALMKKHGILLICDEVMAGFGRTGTMFAFEQFGIIPDLVTMAKGLTSSYVPLGAVALHDNVAAKIRATNYFGGLTYNAHPYCCNVACAVLDVMKEEHIVDHAHAMGIVMGKMHADLKRRHPCVHAVRNVGMFGVIEIGDGKGKRITAYNGAHPVMGAIAKHFREQGLFTFVRWSCISTNPPLTITEEELQYGFKIIDAALDKADATLGLVTLH